MSIDRERETTAERESHGMPSISVRRGRNNRSRFATVTVHEEKPPLIKGSRNSDLEELGVKNV